MNELWRVLRSPKVSILAVLAVVVLAGFAILLLGYQGVAAKVDPPAQTPFLISGSLIGLALLGTALRLLTVHLDRVEAATEREQLAAVQREALRLLADEARET